MTPGASFKRFQFKRKTICGFCEESLKFHRSLKTFEIIFMDCWNLHQWKAKTGLLLLMIIFEELRKVLWDFLSKSLVRGLPQVEIITIEF